MHRFVTFILILLTILLAAGVSTAEQNDETDAPRVYISGLEGSVEISRDEWGVPSIRASSNRDLFIGLGYAMAQDRVR